MVLESRVRTGGEVRVALVIVALMGLACGGLAELPEPEPEPPPVELPEPEPPPVATRTTLPADPFEPVDGFLGVAPLEGAAWAPAEGVLVPDAAGWEDIAPGATFSGLWSGGRVTLAFEGVRDVAWCGETASRAVLRADGPAEGLVWITQEPGEEVASRPRTTRAPAADRRLYVLPGGAELDLRPGRTVLENGGARPWVDLYGGSGVDLRSDRALGPAYPELAWLSGEALLVALRRHRAEGVELLLLRVAGRQGQLAGAVGLPGGCR